MIQAAEGWADTSAWMVSIGVAVFVAGVVVGILIGVRFDVRTFQRGVEHGFDMAYRQFVAGMALLKRPPEA